MTITVTPNPTATPPSCTVSVSVTTGSVMSAVSVWRNDSNGRSLLRSQPIAGFDSRTVTDYECPYEQNVTYDWAATYIDPALFVTVFNSTWAALTGWTQLSGSWNVSGGKARAGSTGVAYLRRTTTAAHYRLTVGSLTAAAGESATVQFSTATGVSTFYVQNSAGVVGFGGFTLPGKTLTAIDPSQPITIDMFDNSVVVSGTGGSYTVSGSLSPTAILLGSVALAANSVQFGAVKLESYPDPSQIAEQSSVVNLEPDEAWLIHPGSPNLSFPLAQASGEVAGIRSIEPIVNRSNTTVHKVLGSATPIPTTTGPRSDDETVVSIGTMTTSESSSLRALLADDVPLLIQFPPSWDLDFNSGFYQPGDVTTSRIVDLPVPYRVFTLPLQKVQSPVVDIENTGWSYASVAVEFATYADLLTSFGTDADLASNTRL